MEPKGDLVHLMNQNLLLPHATSAQKLLASSSLSELREKAVAQEEASTDVVPSLKKSKHAEALEGPSASDVPSVRPSSETLDTVLPTIVPSDISELPTEDMGTDQAPALSNEEIIDEARAEEDIINIKEEIEEQQKDIAEASDKHNGNNNDQGAPYSSQSPQRSTIFNNNDQAAPDPVQSPQKASAAQEGSPASLPQTSVSERCSPSTVATETDVPAPIRAIGRTISITAKARENATTVTTGKGDNSNSSKRCPWKSCWWQELTGSTREGWSRANIWRQRIELRLKIKVEYR